MKEGGQRANRRRRKGGRGTYRNPYSGFLCSHILPHLTKRATYLRTNRMQPHLRRHIPLATLATTRRPASVLAAVEAQLFIECRRWEELLPPR